MKLVNECCRITSGVSDVSSSAGMTSWRPVLMAFRSCSTHPTITFEAYKLEMKMEQTLQDKFVVRLGSFFEKPKDSLNDF